MSVPYESPEEVTQQIPRIPPPGPADTAPLWRSEIGKLDSLMATNVIGNQPPPPVPPQPPKRALPFKALGLVGIAVLSGLVWLALSTGGSSTPELPPPGTSATATAGEFAFVKSDQVPEPMRDSKCADHAYGQTKDFLIKTPCQQLVRAAFTTKLADGRTAYTSVSIVRMRSTEDATKFKELTSADGTGNVNDLVLEGVVTVPGLKSLAKGGFANQLRDRDVLIVETDAMPHGPDEAAHNKLMKRISTDAFRLAKDMN